VLCARTTRTSGIVEYCELDEERLNMQDDAGKLKFGAANICNHYFSVDFLQNVANNPMPYHIAKKKIPCFDGEKTAASPDVNGVKMEHFIFDCFDRAKNLTLWEVTREDEFGPVKNAEAPNATDTASSARKMLSDLHRRWIEKAGGKIDGDGLVEIDPLVSYGGEGLQQLKGKTIDAHENVDINEAFMKSL